MTISDQFLTVCLRRPNHLRKVRESVSADRGSSNHTANGDHGKTSVLELLQPVFLLLFRVSGVKSHRIERVVTRFTIVVVHVGKSRECACLNEGDPSEDLDHGFGELVVGLQDCGDVGEGVGFSWDANEFRNNHTQSGQHGGTSVLQLGLTEPGDPLRGTLQYNNTIQVIRGAG